MGCCRPNQAPAPRVPPSHCQTSPSTTRAFTNVRPTTLKEVTRTRDASVCKVTSALMPSGGWFHDSPVGTTSIKTLVFVFQLSRSGCR